MIRSCCAAVGREDCMVSELRSEGWKHTSFPGLVLFHSEACLSSVNGTENVGHLTEFVKGIVVTVCHLVAQSSNIPR